MYNNQLEIKKLVSRIARPFTFVLHSVVLPLLIISFLISDSKYVLGSSVFGASFSRVNEKYELSLVEMFLGTSFFLEIQDIKNRVH